MSYSPDYSLKLFSERRRSDRRPISLDMEVLEIGDARRPASLIDISNHGAMFSADHSWKVGARIWLLLPANLSLNARIVWQNERRHGCSFLRSVDDSVLQPILTAANRPS